MRRTRSLDANSTANGEPGLGDVGRGSGSALDNKVDAAFGYAGVFGTALSDHDLPQLPRIDPVLDEFIGHDLAAGHRQVSVGKLATPSHSPLPQCGPPS